MLMMEIDERKNVTLNEDKKALTMVEIEFSQSVWTPVL